MLEQRTAVSKAVDWPRSMPRVDTTRDSMVVALKQQTKSGGGKG